MTTPCTVVVVLTPQEGMSDQVQSVITRELAEIRQGDGCLSYEMFVRVDQTVVLIESWSNREAWQAHFDTPAISRLKRDLTPLLSIPAERWEMYPSGEERD